MKRHIRNFLILSSLAATLCLAGCANGTSSSDDEIQDTTSTTNSEANNSTTTTPPVTTTPPTPTPPIREFSFALSSKDSDITSSESNGVYTITNTNNVDAKRVYFVLSNTKTGTLYFFLKSKSLGSDKTVTMRLNTNQTDINNLTAYNSYIANLDLNVTTTEKEQKFIFFIDEREHKEGIDINFKIPANSTIQFEFTKIEGGYGPTYQEKKLGMWVQEDWIENAGYIYSELLNNNEIEYTYNFLSSYKNNYQGWEISGRYWWTPEGSGTYDIVLDSNTNSEFIFEIQNDFAPYTCLDNTPIKSGNNKYTVTIPNDPNQYNGRVIRFNIPIANFDDTDHKFKISNFSITKHP